MDAGWVKPIASAAWIAVTGACPDGTMQCFATSGLPVEFILNEGKTVASTVTTGRWAEPRQSSLEHPSSDRMQSWASETNGERSFCDLQLCQALPDVVGDLWWWLM